jgi:hypothetical protein
MKNVKAARVGDTWHSARKPVAPLPGFKPAKSMVFAGVYPASRDDFEPLASAIDKLTLNDASVSARRESSEALGAGFRCAGSWAGCSCEAWGGWGGNRRAGFAIALGWAGGVGLGGSLGRLPGACRCGDRAAL